MKAYFDDNGNLVIEPRSSTEAGALMMWKEINESADCSIHSLLNDEIFSLKLKKRNANSNATSVTKSELE